MDVDVQVRFLEPLKTALNGLQTIIPKLTFVEVTQFLDELLLYINRLMPFVVAECTGVLNQLLKIVFGRTNETTVKKMAIKRTASLKQEADDSISYFFADFAYYLAKVSNDTVEEAFITLVFNVYDIFIDIVLDFADNIL